jgi:hypothetical protein
MDVWLHSRLQAAQIEDDILLKYILSVLEADEPDTEEQLASLLESACAEATVPPFFRYVGCAIAYPTP